jgi:hypothetical protein
MTRDLSLRAYMTYLKTNMNIILLVYGRERIEVVYPLIGLSLYWIHSINSHYMAIVLGGL